MSQQFEGNDALTDGKGRKKFEKHHRETSISDMDNVSVTEVANVQNVSKCPTCISQFLMTVSTMTER